MKKESISIRFYVEQAGREIDLSVMSLRYTCKIHSDYAIVVDVVDGDGSQSTFDISPDSIASQWAKVMVSFHKSGKSMCLQGLVRSVKAVPYFSQRQRILRITLSSELSRGFSRYRSVIYYSPTMIDVLNKGIKDQAQQNNAANYTDFQWRINAPDTNQYPQHFQLGQFGETDGEFISRTIMRHGAWFNYYQDLSASLHDKSSKVAFVVGDSNAGFIRYANPIKLLEDTDMQGDGVYLKAGYYSDSMGIRKICASYYDESSGKTLVDETQVVYNKTVLRNWNLKVPFNNLNQDQVTRYASNAADAERVRKRKLDGFFQGHLIQAGNIIDLDIGRYGINGDCIVTEVCYQFYPDENSDALIYEQDHSFVAYELSAPYREKLLDHNANLPIYTGAMSGVFAETGGKDTVTPDEQGRIPVIFPFDQSYFCNGAKARYTRLSAKLNSGDAGVSFPYYADTEFQVSFADGCIDRPLIMGTAATNQSQHIHSPELQQRTAHVLPQGQEMTYTNTLGNTTAMKFGTKHQEGDHHTFMMLNNYPSQTREGDKHLDFVQATTANHEHQITGNLTEKFGGNKVQGAQEQDMPHWITLGYFDQYSQPVKDLPYSVTFDDGSTQQGKLPASGKVTLSDLKAKQATKIAYGDPAAQSKLQTQRQKLQMALDGIINQVKAQAKKDNQELQQHNDLWQRWQEGKSFSGGMFDSLWSQAKSVAQTAKTAYEIAVNGITPQQLQAVRNALNNVKQTMMLLASDKPTQDMLENFAKQYAAAASPLQIARIAGECTGYVVPAVAAAILTAGVGDVAIVAEDAGAASAEASSDMNNLAQTIQASQRTKTVYGKAVDAEHLEHEAPVVPVKPDGVDEGAEHISQAKLAPGNDPTELQHPSGNSNNLPAKENPNFSGNPVPKILPPGTKIYRVIDDNLDANGRYWAYDLPSSKPAWRSMFAVKGWNADGSYVEYTVGSEGLPAWEGKAASQMYREEGQPEWLQSGGGTQIFIPRASTVIPKSLVRIPTNWE